MAKSPRMAYKPNADIQHIDELLSAAQDKELNEWENEFIEGLIRSKKTFSGLGGLTMPQYEKLKQIAEKEDEFEVW